MPRSAQSLRITDAYRKHLKALGAAAADRALAGWTDLDPSDLDGTFPQWRKRAELLLAGAQRAGVLLADAYLAAYLTSELGDSQPAPGIDPDSIVGTTRNGGPLDALLTLPLIAVKQAISSGRPVDEALAYGKSEAHTFVRTEAIAASCDAMAEAVRSDERIVGWQRVTSGKACGACLGLADAGLRRTDAGLEIHNGCSCTAEPVVAGVEERVKRPSGSELFGAMSHQEQDELLGEKADLIRSGKATLRDLVQHEHYEHGHGITEKPLAALT